MKRKENTKKLIEMVKELMKSDTNLRHSQVKALHQFTDSSEMPERGIFNLATGVGKTRIMSMLALAHLENNPDSQIIVAVPNVELFQQELDAFQEYRNFQEKKRKELGMHSLDVPERLDMGVFNQFDKNTTSPIIFTSYHSLENLAHSMDRKKVGLLLLDEAHHAISERRHSAVDSFTNAMHYGMTATPWYSPDRNAENVLGKVIAKISIKDAIQDKEPALAEYKNILMVSDLKVDLSKVQKEKATGEYKQDEYWKEISHAMRGNSANSGNEDNWKEAHHFIAEEVARRYCYYVDEHVGPLNGKKCLINCRSQEEARIQAQELNKLFGRIVAKVHTSDECDDQTIKDFKEGNLPIVCQVGKLTEGFDMPNLDMTINYPTCSRVREAQGAARCIRLPKVDSKTPGIIPKKMGLVIDIAFEHPDYDNVVDAIRANHQVLFQSVDGVESPVIQHIDESLQVEELNKAKLEELRKKSKEEEEKKSKEEEEKKGKEKGKGKKHKPKNKDERIGFTIISDIRELQRLTREANELQAERYVPPKRDGMRSTDDFYKEYGILATKVRKWFNECYEKGIKFYLDSDKKHEHPIDLVQKVKSKTGFEYLCLDEHPEALKMFMEMYPEIKKSLENKKKKKDVPLKRDGMRSTSDFFKEFGIQDTKVRKWFDECYEQGIKFYLDSDKKHEHPIDLVQRVINDARHECLCLDEHPEALRMFMEMHPEIQQSLENKKKKKDVPLKRDGMRSTSDFFKEFGTKPANVKQWFEECYEKGIKFYLDSDKKHEHPIDLIQRVKDARSGQVYLCLDEHPEALRKFMEIVIENTKHKATREKYSTLLKTLQTASEKGGKVKQVVKAPNPPEMPKKLATHHGVKKAPNIPTKPIHTM